MTIFFTYFLFFFLQLHDYAMLLKSGQGLLIYKAMVSILCLLMHVRLKHEGQLNTYRWCLFLHILQLQYHKTKDSQVWRLFMADPSVFNEEKGEIALSVLARNLPVRMMNVEVKQFESTFRLVPQAMESTKALGVDVTNSGNFESDGLNHHETVKNGAQEVVEIQQHFIHLFREMKANQWRHYPLPTKAAGLFKTALEMKNSRVILPAPVFMYFDSTESVTFLSTLLGKRVVTNFIQGDPAWPEVKAALAPAAVGIGTPPGSDDDDPDEEDDEDDNDPPAAGQRRQAAAAKPARRRAVVKQKNDKDSDGKKRAQKQGGAPAKKEKGAVVVQAKKVNDDEGRNMDDDYEEDDDGGGGGSNMIDNGDEVGGEEGIPQSRMGGGRNLRKKRARKGHWEDFDEVNEGIISSADEEDWEQLHVEGERSEQQQKEDNDSFERHLQQQQRKRRRRGSDEKI